NGPVAAHVGVGEDRSGREESAGPRTQGAGGKHAETATHHQARVSCGRISKSDAWTEVLPVVFPRRIAEPILPEDLILSFVQKENPAAVLLFVVPERSVPAQADIQCQLAADPDVILNKQCIHG